MGDRRRTSNRVRALILVVMAGAVITLASCQNPLAPITSQRTLSFDVSALLFGPTPPSNPPPASFNPGTEGPGIDTISVTITVIGSNGKDSTLSPVSFSSSSIPAGAAYGNLEIPVSGELKEISVVGTLSGKTVVSTNVSDIPAAAVSRYGGWRGFANVSDFKITWSGGSSSTGTIRVLPCPRSAATILVDSGVQSGSGNTDLASSLKSLQVALAVNADEYTGNGDLKYDVYYAIAKIDPSIVYDDALFSNTYLSDPWTAQWTYDEVTGSSGKKIGPTTYVMTKLSGGPFTAGTLDSSGKLAATLVDLSSVSGVSAGEYLLYCVVFTRGGLSVPSDVGVVEIQ